MHKFLLPFFATTFLTSASFAFTCLNDYSGSNGCAKNPTPAGDCATLGYSTAAIPSNCERVLACPFNLAYKRCVKTKDECPDGYSINYTSKESCGTEATWTFDGQLVGSLFCGKCTCNAPSNCLYDSSSGIGTLGGKCCNGKYQTCTAPVECKWTDSNKGTANLSDKCCNGNYKTCTSACVEVTVPANATASEKCTGCGKEVVTAFNCNTGYTKTADGKSCVQNYKPCEVGWIFYSDFTCEENFNKAKWAVGVITEAFGNSLSIIALHNVGMMQGKGESHEFEYSYFDPDNSCWTSHASPVLASDCYYTEAGSDGVHTEQYRYASIDDVRSYKPCADGAATKNISVSGLSWYIPGESEAEAIYNNYSKISSAFDKIRNAVKPTEFVINKWCGGVRASYYVGASNRIQCSTNRCEEKKLRFMSTILRSNVK